MSKEILCTPRTRLEVLLRNWLAGSKTVVLSPGMLLYRAEYKTVSGKNTTCHVKFAMSTWYWHSLTSTTCSTHSLPASDTPLIDRLVMKKFVSGLSSYRSIHKRVRDRKPSLRGRVRGQFVDLDQSSLRNYNFLETDSYLRVDLNPLKNKFTRSYVRNLKINFPTLFSNRYKIRVRFVFRTFRYGNLCNLRARGHFESSRRSARR